MLPISTGISSEQRLLLKIFDRLPPEDKAALMSYAEYLGDKSSTRQPETEIFQDLEPQIIPRPDEESVISAMRRLSASYPMLEKSALLHQSAALLSEHMMQGRASVEVIDELERLFEEAFEVFKQSN